MNALEPFQAGEVRIADDVLTPATHPRRDAALLQRVRRRVGMVFQQFDLFPHMTVLENLIEAPTQVSGEPRETATERAKQLLERMDLAEKLEARPKQLSGDSSSEWPSRAH